MKDISMGIIKNDLHDIVQSSPLDNVNTIELKSFGISQVWKNQQQMKIPARQMGLIFNIVHNGYVSWNKTLPPLVQEINTLFDAEIIVKRDILYSLNNRYTVNYDVNTYNVLANIGRTDQDNDIAIIYLKKALVINKGQYLQGLQSFWIPAIRRKLLLDKISLHYHLVSRFKQLGANDVAQHHNEIAEKHLNSLDIQLFKSHTPSIKTKNTHPCNDHKLKDMFLNTI